MVRPAPVAYLMLMAVLPGERGAGVGAALAARLHREVEAAGVTVTLLHYEQTNPLSVPFWSQQGYRLLWTSWEARPARVLRWYRHPSCLVGDALRTSCLVGDALRLRDPTGAGVVPGLGALPWA